MTILTKGKAFTENHLVIYPALLFRAEVTEYNMDEFILHEIGG